MISEYDIERSDFKTNFMITQDQMEEKHPIKRILVYFVFTVILFFVKIITYFLQKSEEGS